MHRRVLGISRRLAWLRGAFIDSVRRGGSGRRPILIEEKAQICSACHGEAGIPQEKTTPVIWGQNEGYLYLNLRDFNKGSRKNEQMSAIAADLTKDEMKQLAAYFSKQPWPKLQQPSPPDDVAKKALTAIGSIGCPSCHLDQLQGDGTTARLAGQQQAVPQANDARLPRRQPRQQSRHVGSDEGDLARRHRRHLALRRGAADTRRHQRPLKRGGYLLGRQARAQLLVGRRDHRQTCPACHAPPYRRRG